MADYTENLSLYEIDKANDVFNTFDIDTVLNENWEKIDQNVVNKDGTVPFIAEQQGVDPTSIQGLTTKHYVDINTIKLGETETTAYRGDRGKIAYDHSQIIGNPHATTKANIGLGSVQNTDTTTTVNITDSFDKRFVTEDEKIKLDNTSGVNTGDETRESIELKLGTDYTNLVKRDGTIPFIAEQQGVTPTLSNSLATKSYVDNKVFDNFAQSFTANGYTKLPNGLIFQWGQTSITTFQTFTETNIFPIAFPNACLTIQLNTLYSGGYAVAGGYSNIISKSNTEFVVEYSCPKYWFAIGY